VLAKDELGVPVTCAVHQQLGHGLARFQLARARGEFKHLGVIERVLEPDGLGWRRRGTLLRHRCGHDGYWRGQGRCDMRVLGALCDGAQGDQST
jgi:hypothetical protein